MGNCLVTKLKSVVVNDNLERLGYVTIPVKKTSANDALFFLSYSGLNPKMYIKGATFTDGSTEHVITNVEADMRAILPVGEYRLSLPKYGNLADIQMNIIGVSMDLNLKDLMYYRDPYVNNVQSLILPFNKTTGDLSDIVHGSEKMWGVNLYSNNEVKVTGNIEDLAYAYKNLALGYSAIPILNLGWQTQITGSMKTFLDRLADPTFGTFGQKARRMDCYIPGTAISMEGLPSSVGVNFWVDFNGNGSYTFTNK